MSARPTLAIYLTISMICSPYRSALHHFGRTVVQEHSGPVVTPSPVDGAAFRNQVSSLPVLFVTRFILCILFAICDTHTPFVTFPRAVPPLTMNLTPFFPSSSSIAIVRLLCPPRSPQTALNKGMHVCMIVTCVSLPSFPEWIVVHALFLCHRVPVHTETGGISLLDSHALNTHPPLSLSPSICTTQHYPTSTTRQR